MRIEGTLSDDISSGGGFDDVDWSEDGSQLAFVSTSRDHKDEKFRIADAATGAVREVFEEKVGTQFESGRSAIDWRFLPKTNEILWYSERGQLGVIMHSKDATTGKLKNSDHKGDWLVSRLYKVDEKKAGLYCMVTGREPENPSFQPKVSGQLRQKSPGGAHPGGGESFYDRFYAGEKIILLIHGRSRTWRLAAKVLCNLQGKVVVALEKTDITRAFSSGDGLEAADPFYCKGA